MKSNKNYVAIKRFLPSETLKKSSVHPLLTLQIGDLIELTKLVNEDWAFGRLLGSTECALFPLSYAKLRKTVDNLETGAIHMINIWWQQTKKSYASGSDEKSFDHKLNIISHITSTLDCLPTSKSPTILPIIIEDNCESFGMGLHLINHNNGQKLNIDNYEFNDLVQLVKQKRIELGAKKNVGSNLTTLNSGVTDIEQVSSLLIKLSFIFEQQSTHCDNELIISFVQPDTLLPCYESYRISDLSNPSSIYILLEDLDSSLLDSLQIKVDIFLSSLQTLPGFFIDESQHEMHCYKGSVFSSLSKKVEKFTKTIDLKTSNSPRSFLNGKMNIIMEPLLHKSKSALDNELKQRQITHHTLMALNTRSSNWNTSNKDSVYLTFDFTNMPEIQVERLQLIMHVVDIHGTVLKDAFAGSTTFNTSSLPIEKTLTGKNYLQYYLFGPKDQLRLHLEINLPKSIDHDLHLRLLFYNSTQEGRLIGNLPVAASFVRLIEKDALIGIGSTELFLHKVESTPWIVSLKYLKLFGTRRDQRHHSNVVDTEHTIPSIPINISTLSTNFTHNQNVLALLKCVEKGSIIRAIDQLSSISGDFAMFLPRFLPKLFDKLGTDSELDRKIFGFVNALFKRSEYIMEHNLKRVLEQQISSLKDHRVYGSFFALLNSSIIPTNTSQEDTAFWIDTVKGSANMTKIIVLSASSDPQLINYRQSNSTTNFVHQHLNSKFTLLLNSLISNLCDKNAHFADHQWIHLKSIPNMTDILFNYGIFDAKSLCLFLIELVRAVPFKMKIARIEIIRTITQLTLFKVDEVRRNLLLPAFIPIIFESLQISSTKPETKILNPTVASLLNTLHLFKEKLHEDSNQLARQELLSIIVPSLRPIIHCCNTGVYDRHEEIQMLSQTLFMTTIDIIDAQMFASYLESFEEENDVSDILNEFLKALRPFTETSTIQLFNEEPIKLVIHRQCIKFFQFIKCILFNRRTFVDFQLAVWKELMHILHSFLMNSNEIINNLYTNQVNALRLSAVECLRSMWFSLTVKQKLTLSRNMLESVLDLLSSIQCHGLNSTLLTMFGDILKTEGYYYSERVRNRADQSFTVYKLLHSKLMKRPANLANRTSLCSEMEEELHSVVLCDQKFSCVKKLNVLPQFLKLINFGRESLFRNNAFEIGLIYYKFLDFWYDIEEQEMIIDYVLRLYFFYKSKKEPVEAAFSLQNYAKRLSWNNNYDNPGFTLLSKRLKLDTINESRIKEKLYWNIVELFGEAQFWELGISILKELEVYYETMNIDYQELAKVMGTLQEYYQLIAKEIRNDCPYFLVAFYGNQQPEYLQNEKFVFRGEPREMIGSFRQRIVLNFGCELLTSLDEDPVQLSSMAGKHATVASVQAVPMSEYVRLSEAENPLLSWFYKHNNVDTFVMTRPMIRKESKWTEKFGLNDTTKLWIRRTEYKLDQTLPGILPFREVCTESNLDPLNPLQSACLTILNTNEELNFNSRLVAVGFTGAYVKTLEGQLRGIVQAFVGGGISNYEAFVSNQVDEILIQDGSLADKDRLKDLLVEQVRLLDYGFYIYGCHLNDASRPLYNSLIDSFQIYHKTIQRICGVECSIGLARKSSFNHEMPEPTGRRHSIKYLSRLSAESVPNFEVKTPGIQERSISINCPEGSGDNLLRGPSKPKLSRTDAPPTIPSRKSKRHSSKLLIPME